MVLGYSQRYRFWDSWFCNCRGTLFSVSLSLSISLFSISLCEATNLVLFYIVIYSQLRCIVSVLQMAAVRLDRCRSAGFVGGRRNHQRKRTRNSCGRRYYNWGGDREATKWRWCREGIVGRQDRRSSKPAFAISILCFFLARGKSRGSNQRKRNGERKRKCDRGSNCQEGREYRVLKLSNL